MPQKILYLFTRTPLHVGAGASVGAIDQPIVRERHTGFPIIPGSAIKGVLADGSLKRENGELITDDNGRAFRTDEGIALYGRQDHEVNEMEGKGHKSGDISIAEAKLLAFPVRSAKGCFAWVTSPMILERWMRDTGKTAGLPESFPGGLHIYGDADTLALENEALEGTVVLEDYAFDLKGPFSPGTDVTSAISDTLWSKLCAQHLCLISDDMMAHFARNACEVAQHVSISDETGAADEGKLFNQENVPAETLFYSIFTELRSGAFMKLTAPSVLQIGGDATTGHGFCTAELNPQLTS